VPGGGSSKAFLEAIRVDPDATECSNRSRPRQRWWRVSDWRPYVLPMWAGWRREAPTWPLALPLAPVVFVIAAQRLGWAMFYSPDAGCKATYENIAVPLMVVTTCAWVVRAWVGRSRFYALLAAQAFVFTCREVHFSGTHRGVYLATAAIAVWAVAWAWRHRERLDPKGVDWRQMSFLAATVLAYAVAMVIQRRAFKWIPGERGLHLALEECTETAAHLLFLGTALVGSWRRRPGGSSIDSPSGPASREADGAGDGVA